MTFAIPFFATTLSAAVIVGSIFGVAGLNFRRVDVHAVPRRCGDRVVPRDIRQYEEFGLRLRDGRKVLVDAGGGDLGLSTSTEAWLSISMPVATTAYGWSFRSR